MKRFLLPFIFFFFLLCGTALAQDYSFPQKDTGVLNVSSTGTQAVLSYRPPSSKPSQGLKVLLVCDYEPTDNLCPANHNLLATTTITSSAPVTINNLSKDRHTYYIALGFRQFVTFESGWPDGSAAASLLATTSEVSSSVLTFDVKDSYVNVSGKIDTVKYPYPELFFIQLEWSSQGTFSTDPNQKPEGYKTAQATLQLGGNVTGVNHDGTYYWRLTNIDPTAYWYRETFYTQDGKKVGVPTLGKFNGASGLSITTPSEVQKDFEARSYRLLAPLPGFNVLLDPELCREQKIENPGKGQVCDINDFLNYVFRLMIGVAAVVLVIRIIIEGFKYATSDVLSIKISSKQKLFQGIWGLLLALSAWLILNTINPKLVENNINLPSVNLNVDEQLALTYAGYDINGKLPDPADIKNLQIQWDKNYQSVQTTYIPALNKVLPNIPKGMKTLMAAQTSHEGFYPGSKSYRTNNPGNIGNTDDGSTKTFSTLEEGIKAQYDYITRAISGQNKNFTIGTTNPAALGTETYQGYLYQYIRIYATGAQKDNSYLNFIIAYFKKESLTITQYMLVKNIVLLQ